MPTETQRADTQRVNDAATNALVDWEKAHWELSIEGKAAFLSGYLACLDVRERGDWRENARRAAGS